MAEDTGSKRLTAERRLDGALLDAYARDYGEALKKYFARRGASAHHAEDLAQEVFLRLAVRADGGTLDNPEAYLMRVASSVWLSYLQRQKPKFDAGHVAYEDTAHSPEGFSPERVLEGREAVKRLAESFRDLPARTRHVYFLCRLDGMKRGEVARRLGITVSAVDKHLMVATKHVKTVLGELL